MILDDIVAAKQKQLSRQKAQVSEEQMKKLAFACSRTSVSFYEALAKPGLSIIGEFKKASPSMGVIQNKLKLEDRIDQYNQSVDAISCLTEQEYFHGSPEYLKEIRKISPLPIIRKDFIIDAYQIYEAKWIGADAILLIAAILSLEDMKQFYELAGSLGLDVLVEVHDEREMEQALKMNPKIVGVNNRNLKDFTISLENTRRLRPMAGDDVVFVSESGVSERAHILFLKECNVDALLIGRSFMEAENPKELAKEWKELYEQKQN